MTYAQSKKLIGTNNSQLGNVDLGSLYPVLDTDNDTILGFYSAELGTPKGYVLDESLQAFIKAN